MVCVREHVPKQMKQNLKIKKHKKNHDRGERDAGLNVELVLHERFGRCRRRTSRLEGVSDTATVALKVYLIQQQLP